MLFFLIFVSAIMAIQGVYLSLLNVIFTLKGLVQISLEQLDSNKINSGEKNMKKIAIIRDDSTFYHKEPYKDNYIASLHYLLLFCKVY